MMAEAWMEVLPPPAPYFSGQPCSPCWFMPDRRGGGGGGAGAWTTAENKVFEQALASIDGDAPNRWEMVAKMLPNKTIADVENHYRDLENDVGFIEAGLVPFPHYSTASPSSGFTLAWDGGDGGGGGGGFRRGCCLKRARAPDQERKKGVPWTEDEHKLFLMGLKKYGRGDWRNISRNFVTSRTPTQVASHAQKYFIRLNSGGKDKRRSSIHDITTVNLPDDDHGNPSPSPPSALTTASPPVVPDHFGAALVDAKPVPAPPLCGHRHFTSPAPTGTFGVGHPYSNVKLEPKSSFVAGMGLGIDDSVFLQMQCGQL